MRRFAAFLIDMCFMLGLYMFCGLILGVGLFAGLVSALPMVGLWFFGGMWALSWAYYAILESSKYQATLGKRLLGLKVTDLSRGRIGLGRASVRYFFKVSSYLFLMVGVLMIPFTRNKQGLHDKVAGTLVLKK